MKNPLKALHSLLTRFMGHVNPVRLQVTPPELFKARRDSTPGLAIRALRMRTHAYPTKRMGRSKYVPDGFPARITKVLKRRTFVLNDPGIDSGFPGAAQALTAGRGFAV